MARSEFCFSNEKEKWQERKIGVYREIETQRIERERNERYTDQETEKETEEKRKKEGERMRIKEETEIKV